MKSAPGPVQAPPPSVAASGRWEHLSPGWWADRRGPRHALPASAIEASSAVAATKARWLNLTHSGLAAKKDDAAQR
jgi:hypothetical protein